MKPECLAPPRSTSSSGWPNSDAGDSLSSVTPTSCRPSAGEGCSTSCAPPAASTSCPASTASTKRWEAAASLQLRTGDPGALDAYEAHDRIVAGTFDDHVELIARDWVGYTLDGKTVAITAATNDHVDALNDAVQRIRLTIGQLRPDVAVTIAGGELAYAGDIVATRRNDRELRTSSGEPVRNRDLWDVVATHADGALTVSHRSGHGTVSLPPDYVEPACAPRLRRHRTRPPGRHRRRRHRARLHRHHPSRALRRGDPRPRRQPRSTSSPRPPISPKPATCSSACSPTTGPTSPPSPNDATSPARSRPTTRRRPARRADIDHPRLGGALENPARATARGPHRLPRRPSRPARRGRRRTGRSSTGARRRPRRLAALRPRIAEIEDELRTELRPAMWKANHDAMHASFGHRHRAAGEPKRRHRACR